MQMQGRGWEHGARSRDNGMTPYSSNQILKLPSYLVKMQLEEYLRGENKKQSLKACRNNCMFYKCSFVACLCPPTF